MSIWLDLEFDGGSAEAYASGLEGLADHLDLLAQVVDEGSRFGDRWVGLSRQLMDLRADRTWEEAGTVAADLRTRAEDIRKELGGAEEQQRARVRERAAVVDGVESGT